MNTHVAEAALGVEVVRADIVVANSHRDEGGPNVVVRLLDEHLSLRRGLDHSNGVIDLRVVDGAHG